MGRAKYLQQLQMQLSKKSNRAGCYSFSISFYWTAILSKTFRSGKSAKAMMTNSNIKTRYIKIQQTKKALVCARLAKSQKKIYSKRSINKLPKKIAELIGLENFKCQ